MGDIVNSPDDSSTIAGHWASMREVFSDEVVCRLAGVSETSLRRYASAARSTPQEIAERLQWLVMVVAHLAGAYNEFGIRRWFERPRAQLDGRSPRELLGEQWHPDDESGQRIRTLAEKLSGAPAVDAVTAGARWRGDGPKWRSCSPARRSMPGLSSSPSRHRRGEE